jgi:predicted PurR-regulated permease PerM
MRAVSMLMRVIIALVVSVILSVVLTVALYPFWSWLERVFGVESLGHSGPSAWCYVFVFCLVSACLMAFIFVLKNGTHKK